MTTAVYLSTAFALICALVSATAAWTALRALADAHREHRSVTNRDARLMAVEEAQAAVILQLQKLRGRFYADRRDYTPAPAVPETSDNVRARLREQLPVPQIGARKE